VIWPILTMVGTALVLTTSTTNAANVDAVVRAPKPVALKLTAGTVTATKKVAIEVVNAASDAAAATLRLTVANGDCPAGIVGGGPDFGKKNAGSADTVLLAPGKKAKATLTLSVSASAFTSPAPKLPARCTLTLAATTTDPAGATDPSPANATASLAIDVLDGNDAAPAPLTEVLTAHPKPLVVSAAPGKIATKNVKVALANASAGGGAGTPDASVTLVTLGGDCPEGIAPGVDLDKKTAGIQTSTTIKAGKKATGTLGLAIDANKFPPGTKTSPARCTLTVGVAAAASTELSNDIARVVLDVAGGTASAPAPNQPPTASFTVGATSVPLVPVAFDGTGSSDPDGDPLTYDWSFGDGVAGGVAALAHAYTQAGSFTVRLTVDDGRGGSAFSEQQVTIGSGDVAQGTAPADGVVRTITGAPLAGVGVVAEGGGTGTTDATGKVTLNVPRGIPFKLTFTKSGYATQYLPYSVPAGTEGAIFEVTMITQEPPQNVNAALGGTVAGKDGATLILPPNGLVTENGTPVTGAVSVAMTPVDPTSAPESFPGRYAGFDSNGAEGLLLSYGTVQYDLRKNGAPVQLAPGASATLELPVYATLDKTGAGIVPGTTIPLWSLDERTGMWVREGTGTVVASSGSPSGIALRGTVGHLSWWNADAFDQPPYKPKPRCMVDSNADGILEDLTGTGHCWNAGTGPEQPPQLPGAPIGLPGTTTPRAVTPRIPAWAAQASIPAAGGVILPMPANLDITLYASAKNGTLVGTKVLNGGPGVVEDVDILLEPLEFEDATPITIPWNTTYTMAVGAVHQYRFAAAAGDPVYVTVSRNASSLQGGVIVEGPDDYEVGPVTFNATAGKLAFIAPAAGQYRIVIDGTAGEPGGYRLQVGETGTVPILVSTSPLADATGVAAGTTVSATFTTAIDPASVTTAGTTASFKILGPIDLVAGTAQTNGSTVTFTPTSALIAGAAYTARLSSGIKSLGGDAFSGPQEWTFTIADDGSPVPIGAGTIPSLAVASNGDMLVAFDQNYPSGGDRGTSVVSFAPGSGWSAPTLLQNQSSNDPYIAAGGDGSAIVIWRGGSSASAYTVYASRYTPAGGWTAADTLDAGGANVVGARARVVVDATGNAIAAWKFGNEARVRRYVPASGWTTTDTLFAAASQPGNDSTSLMMAPNGRAIAARIQADVVSVRRYAPATGWTDAETVSPTGSYFEVRAGIDADGNVLVMWKSSGAWTWRRYDAGDETWNTAAELIADSTPSFLGALSDAQLIMLANGDAIAASAQSQGETQRIWSLRYDADTESWSSPVDVAAVVPCSFMIASAPDGAVAYAAWLTCFGGGEGITWKKYTTATGWTGTENTVPLTFNPVSSGTPPFVHVGIAPDASGMLVFAQQNPNGVRAIGLE